MFLRFYGKAQAHGLKDDMEALNLRISLLFSPPILNPSYQHWMCQIGTSNPPFSFEIRRTGSRFLNNKRGQILLNAET